MSWERSKSTPTTPKRRRHGCLVIGDCFERVEIASGNQVIRVGLLIGDCFERVEIASGNQIIRVHIDCVLLLQDLVVLENPSLRDPGRLLIAENRTVHKFRQDHGLCFDGLQWW